MRTGITQEQVNAAADALIAAGENPTVEKIRTALGTGSPNTITRMLDLWRTQLGHRLQQVIALPEVPGDVGRLMQELWRLAVEHATQQAAARLIEERATLAAQATCLADEHVRWGHRPGRCRSRRSPGARSPGIGRTRLCHPGKSIAGQSRIARRSGATA